MAGETFQMPDEFKGLSPEQLAQKYVADRENFSKVQNEYKSFKEQWEPRAKQWEAYEKYGAPEQIEQLVKWGQQWRPLHEKIAKGEAKVLNDSDWKAYQDWSAKTKNGTQPIVDDPNDELFRPIKQSIMDEVLKAVDGRINERATGFDNNFKATIKTLQDQQNLFAHIMRLQQQHPDINFDELLQEGAQFAQMGPDKLIESLLEMKGKTAGFEKRVQDAVAAELAKREQAKENDPIKAMIDSRKFGGGAVTKKGGREATARAVVSQLNDKFPGLLEQWPVV